MLARMYGDGWNTGQRMWIYGHCLGDILAQDVLIHLLRSQRLATLIVAEEPEPGRLVVLVICDCQVIGSCPDNVGIWSFCNNVAASRGPKGWRICSTSWILFRKLGIEVTEIRKTSILSWSADEVLLY